MTHPTKQEKVEALMKANRSLDFETACKLLGYDPKDPQLNKMLTQFEQLQNMSKGAQQ